MTHSVVLVSGGMDSAVAAAVALSRGNAAFLHVNYGQRTEKRELKAFRAIARHYSVKKKLVVDISHLKAIGGSALTDRRIKVPAGRLKRRSVPATYVPFRNAHLLSIAASWAETIGAKEIYIGAVEEDSSGYPDCRRSFFAAFEKAMRLGTKPGAGLRIRTPLIGLRKSEIVGLGLRLGAPFKMTWSCYRQERAACGSCDSCLLRLRGFDEAGATDPIPYGAEAP